MIERRVIAVEGIVQGVGFRPYVHLLATARDLHGFVRNDSDGVTIDVQGDPASIDDLIAELTYNPPPLATISRISATVAELRARTGFHIAPSEEPHPPVDGAPERTPRISPDVATCDECLLELFDPRDRRYRYPFLNCTHCGPRFTIIEGLPYDRARTTMARFTMCDACRGEYEDPSNRRFHAQPIACPDCGPALRVVWSADYRARTEDDPITATAAVLGDGGVVAIKGLGGYHLACDATNQRAVERLRARKHREAKPLAIMVSDSAAIAPFATVSPDENELLLARECPIVLVHKNADARAWTEAVSPRNAFIGVMLPYTPLHHLILRAVARPLVMTSGNATDDPIAFEDADALQRLSPIADMMLTHDRPIATRCDDSVMRVAAGAPAFLRRSRGFAPGVIDVPARFPSHTLALGGQLKNTFCLGRDRLAFVSHHIGDLETAAACGALEEEIARYAGITGVQAEVVVHDLHPGYRSTQVAGRIPGVERVAVQHHHAHIAACMAENGVTDPVIGVAFDGAGLGDDGAIWGGEFLLVERTGYRRMGHLGYVPLPGGDAAVRRPLRMALAHLWAAFGGDIEMGNAAILGRARPGEAGAIAQMVRRGFNSPPTSSIGRLFDAVASLIGVRDDAMFEGQAAMELEAMADPATARKYPVEIKGGKTGLVVDPGAIIRAVAADLDGNVPRSEIAGALHKTLSATIATVARSVRDLTGVNRIALSGGVFQNVLLTTLSAAELRADGFDVLQHRLVPCNDGGLSLGQAYVVALGSTEG